MTASLRVQVRCIEPTCNAFIRYEDCTDLKNRQPKEECPKCRREREDREYHDRPWSKPRRWTDDW